MCHALPRDGVSSTLRRRSVSKLGLPFGAFLIVMIGGEYPSIFLNEARRTERIPLTQETQRTDSQVAPQLSSDCAGSIATGVGAPSATRAARSHLRGSSLFLAGRLFSLFTNFFVQVLTVRYLQKSEFGAFAVALSIVSVASSLNLLGLHRAVSRFVPIYHERRDYGTMLGTMLLSVGSILGLGLALVAATVGFQGLLASWVVNDPLAVGLLLILIGLAPLEALDSTLQGMAAALSSPKSIVFRRYILGPLLRLAAVLVVLLATGNVRLLAVCYLAAGLLGAATYVVLIVQTLRKEGLLERFDVKSLRMPFREIFGFSIPLISTDAVLILRTTLAVVILEHFRGTTGVADFRAVVPVAGLSLLVIQSHKILFGPSAARLHAKDDGAGINDLYWQSTIWITILTFPVFAACLFLADPITELLFGARYSSSQASPAPGILAILAVGNYFNAAMGLNTYALQVYKRVRFITIINVVAAVAGLVLCLVLIPSYGAWGAAIATTASVVIHNLLNHAGLHWRTDIRIFESEGWRVYGSVLAAVLALTLIAWLLKPSVPVSVVAVALASFAIVWVNRRSLRVGETFPRLARIPILRDVFSTKDRG